MARHVIQTDRLMRPIAHFSHALRVGHAIHVGATAGTDADRRLAGEPPGRIDAAAQTDAMLDNLETVLDLLGATPRALTHVKLYVTDVRDMAVCTVRFDQRYAAQGLRPVVVGSAGFPLPHAAVELDAVAHVGGPERRTPAGPPPAYGESRHLLVQPWDGTDALPATDARRQARALIARLRDMTEAAGMTLQDLVRLHVTLADLRHLDALAAELATVLREPGPATTVVAAALPDPMMTMQLEALCVRGGGTPIGTPGGARPLAFTSPAMLAGEVLHIGACTGVGGSESIETQTLAAWDQVLALLHAAGMDGGHIVRTNNALVDWRDYAGFNAGYGQRVRPPYPPRTTVIAGLPAPGARVHIEAVAHRRQEEFVVLDRSGD